MIRKHNLDGNRKVMKRIHVKPVLILWILLFAGALLIVMKPYMLPAGMTIMMLALFAILVMPDRDLCEFTSEYIVLFNQHDRDDCMVIYWEDIVSWRYEKKAAVDHLIFTLTDGTMQIQEMFSKKAIRNYLEQYIPGKEIKGRQK